MKMEVPGNIVSSVETLLQPYGVSFRSLLELSEGNAAVRYITAAQASRYCGLSAKTLREKVLAGEIKARRLGHSSKGRVLILKSSLDKWLDSQQLIA